jgi:S1-C subfamily serine protease
LTFHPDDRDRFEAIQHRLQPALREDLPAEWLRSVVLVDASFEDGAREVASGFFAAPNRGLILTAWHTFRRSSESPIEQIRIGVVRGDGGAVKFRYVAKIDVPGSENVDACVLRITGRAQRYAIPLLSDRPYLSLASEWSMGEDVRLIGYNQGGEGLVEEGTILDCQPEVKRGYVCKYFVITMNGGTRKEIVVEGGAVIQGMSGGPCLSASGKVLGILSRHNSFTAYRWYMVPYSELQKLLLKVPEKRGGWFNVRRGER